MKVRDFGKKIGDIEIKKPSSESLSKSGVLISIIGSLQRGGRLAYA